MEESLQDFQKNNVEEMHLMNKRGIYYITTTKGRISHSVNDIVCLRMRPSQTEHTHKVYSLEDLRELQSKLVLVAAENADSVNKFIEVSNMNLSNVNHSVCILQQMLSKIERLSELLIKLQKAGNVDYTHFSLKCGCSEYNKSDFDKEIVKMEKCLVSWHKTVQKHRNNYPHLNYYTSQQLLDLQKEFGKMMKKPEAALSLKLKQLLLSVTPKPDQSSIQISLDNATKFTGNEEANASSSEQNTLCTLSMVSQFRLSDLNEKQKEMFKTLTEKDEYKTSLVIKAFAELEDDANIDDLREWCMENEHLFKDEDDDDIVLANKETNNEEDITEDNPLVIELIKGEAHEKQIAIEAVKRCKGDLKKAREIALSLSVDDKLSDEENECINEW